MKGALGKKPKGRKQIYKDYNKTRKTKLTQSNANEKDKVRQMITTAAERAFEFGYTAGMVDRNVFRNDKNVEKRMNEVVPIQSEVYQEKLKTMRLQKLQKYKINYESSYQITK